VRTVTKLAAFVALQGCSPGSLQDPTFPTGSRTFVEQRGALYAVNAWDGTVVRFEAGSSGWSGVLAIGGEPTRIAPVGDDELWVTLRASRQVAVLNVSSTRPEETARLFVGAEPHGIVASEDGSRVYVAVSQQDEVIEIDGASRDILRRFAVPDEPRGLALHPSGRALFVQHAFESALTRIDLETGEITFHEPPSTSRPPEEEGEDSIELTPRPTGDPVVGPIGDVVIVPTLYVDNTTPVDDPIESDQGRPPRTGGDGYASSGQPADIELSIGRMNPAVTAIPLDVRTGEILGGEDPHVFFVGAVDGRNQPVRGYASSITFAPEGAQVFVTLQSADAVVALDLRPFTEQGEAKQRSELGQEGLTESTAPDRDTATATEDGEFVETPPFVRPSSAGFWERAKIAIRTGANPSAVAFGNDGRLFVYEAGNRSVADLVDSQVLPTLDRLRTEFQADLDHEAEYRHVVGEPLLDSDVEAGRALFYSATDPRMSGVGSGVSCSTCHFEGRNDGLTWTFEHGVRQTLSLVGPTSETTPVTWTDAVASVADEAMITSQGRMGGLELTEGDTADIQAFVDSQRPVDVQHSGEQSAQIARGEELFRSEEVGCATCHSGPYYTDNLSHPMFGLTAVNTPTLIGIDATAPFLHDGRAPTLYALLLLSRTGEMGNTAGLSTEDLAALEAYLKTL
jgi:DNA-binding beta-propeller fold protein YncE/mono/diheme cytochrome c family protein